MNNSPLKLASYIKQAEKLEKKLYLLKKQKNLSVFGPLLKNPPKIHDKEITLQIDISVIANLEHTIILGDGDSVFPDQKKDFDYLFPEIKDFSDFEAFVLLLEEFPHLEKLHLYGLWGGRFDHQLLIPNQITELFNQNSNLKSCTLYDESNCPSLVLLNTGEFQFNEQISFSLLSPRHQDIVLTGNVEYAGPFHLKAWTGHGISNRAFGAWSIQCQLPIWKYFLSNQNKK